MNVNDNYYEAYDKRYSQVHANNMLWSSSEVTPGVMNFLRGYGCRREDLILELGCGEGRDAIYLLDKSYKVLAVDYSINAINKCNELTNNKYKNYFKQFDIMTDKLEKKFKYIYSIAVLHMFVTDEHRNSFFKFVYDHLTDDGVALICVLGDGKKEYSSDITNAFKDTKRVVMNNDTELDIATTSCKVVSWERLEQEANRNNLVIKEKWISNSIPEFSSSMCIVVTK